jgi:hypothetical protein
MPQDELQSSLQGGRQYQRLVSRLPSLYRPEPRDDTLINRLLLSAGAVLDQAGVQANHVLLAHWFDVADKATWDAHYQAERRDRGLGVANVRLPKDQREIATYPYISDLGRVCNLLGIPPWREPAPLRESVEAYRQRVVDMLDAFRLGLTTVPALRRLIEAELPEDMAGALSAQRWPFAIEEPRALRRWRMAIEVPESTIKAISPLWRWQAPPKADALAVPTVTLQGVAPGAQLDASYQPMIECLNMDARPAAVGLAYAGTLAPGQALRLTPTRRSWLLRGGRLLASPVQGAANAATDPSANGPWAEVEGAPALEFTQLCETADHCLWLIGEQAGHSTLHRFDGSSFTAITEGLPDTALRGLAAWGDTLLVGSDAGLLHVALFPEGDKPHAFVVDDTVTAAVHQLSAWFDGGWAACTDQGLFILRQGAKPLHWLPATPVYAAAVQDQTVWLGVSAGLLRGNAQGSAWHLFDGMQTSEDQSDWRAVQPADVATASGGLPAVAHIATTPDRAIWVGGPHGLARYHARSQEDGQAYQTVLEAFPDVCSAVHGLQVDERGLLWVAAAEGLLRFDGRDLAQYDSAAALWQPLGQADTVYPDEASTEPRGQWRYDGVTSQWLRYKAAQRRFVGASLTLRSTVDQPVAQVLMSDSVLAELGSFTGPAFTPSTELDHKLLLVRVKPEQDRIVNGGLPALPRPQAGSWWRYVQMEPAEIAAPNDRPWWSTEGRLFPPPQARPPWPGHFRANPSMSKGYFDDDAHSFKPDLSNEAAVFIYPPSACVWVDWPAMPRIGVQVRLFKRAGQDIDPAITDRVWAGLQRAKGAGIPVALLVEGDLIHGV